MKNTSTFFKLFAHNIPVKGKDKGAIYDLQNQQITTIPNVLCSILSDLNHDSIQNIKQKYTPNSPELFENYLTFLRQKGLGCDVLCLEDFPTLNLSWDSSSEINIAVIEHDFEHYNLKNTLWQLDDLLCRHLELRIESLHKDVSHLEEILDFANDKVFKSITLLIDYQSIGAEQAELIFERCKKIDFMVIHDSPWKMPHSNYPQNILFIEESLSEMSRNMKEKYIVNMSYFTESQQFNPFYNRKICIDKLGNIKNSLSNPLHFGNVNTHKIRKVISSDSFQKLWHASPDKIIGLRDSALRYATFLTADLEEDNAGLFHIKAPLLEEKNSNV